MFNRILFFLLCYLVISPAIGEVTINGQVTDQVGMPLSYVNIGIVGTKIGTITALDGSYSLLLTESFNQEAAVIRFSSIGYESLTIPVVQFINSKRYNVKLQEKVFILKTAVVKPKFNHLKKIGTTKTNTKRDVRFAISKAANQNLGSEVGKRFKFGKKTVFLEKCFFYVKYNNFDTVRFSINVYTLKNGKPVQSLLKENIITEITNKKKGWLSVDLSPYELYANTPIILSAAWVYHSKEGNYLSLPLKWPAFGNQHFYKFGSQDKWRIFKNMTTAMQLQISY